MGKRREKETFPEIFDCVARSEWLRSLSGDYAEVSVGSYSSLQLSTREPRKVAQGTHSLLASVASKAAVLTARHGVGDVDNGM